MNDSAQLILELARLADELARAVADWPALGEELAGLLLRVDAESESTDLRREVDAFLGKLGAYPAAAAIVRRAMMSGNTGSQRGTKRGVSAEETIRSGSPAGAEQQDGYVAVPVFYGTDRAMLDDVDPRRRYSGGRGTGTPGFGVARVSIPASHDVASLESPRWWKFEISPDAKKHVALLEARSCDEAAFVEELSMALAGADARDALLFVHGYNVSFEDALRRGAQLAFDLKFPGRLLVYSWPSEGRTVRYLVDEGNVEWATPHFVDFLRLALTRVGARTVDVIAHSMGNRALVRALEHFDTSLLPSGSAKLRQVIFAAPDVDADVFRGLAAAISSRAERCTLYASRNDKPLLASQILHRYPRAGDAGDSLVVVPPIDTVDASAVDTSLFSLAHSIFGAKRSILNDIFALIHQGIPPDKRFDLVGATSATGAYWKYRP